MKEPSGRGQKECVCVRDDAQMCHVQSITSQGTIVLKKYSLQLICEDFLRAFNVVFESRAEVFTINTMLVKF